MRLCPCAESFTFVCADTTAYSEPIAFAEPSLQPQCVIYNLDCCTSHIEFFRENPVRRSSP